jgi:hypothetical protein
MAIQRTWSAAGLTLSGLEGPVDSPVATILALHGGGYSAGYWDHPLERSASLLELGPSLGYRVIAIDRPGYGASHGLTGDDVRMSRQAEVILEVADQLRLDSEDAPVFLIGHSMGAILSLRAAADDTAGTIAGVEISGLPFVFDATLIDRKQLETVDYLPENPAEFKRQLFYGPEETFDPEVLSVDATLSRPVPAAEIIDAVECPDSTPILAKSVRVPIQITRAEFESSSGGGREGLERCGALFTASPRVALHWQVATGHNISLHRVARPYHLRAIAFFDETLAATSGPA